MLSNTPIPNTSKHLTRPSPLSQFEIACRHKGQAQAAQVNDRIESGYYEMETKPCFCGSDKEIQLTKKERSGITHRMVICEECALIRANPRLTAKSYEEFYNTEYRSVSHMISGSVDNPLRDNMDALALHWVVEQNKGRQMRQAFLDQGQDIPKTVLDFGCWMGGVMGIWRDEGADVVGVEFSVEGKLLAERMGFKMYSTLDELIAQGRTFDLIIMQDIIEHLTDLPGDMKKIEKLLADKGILYVWTPGLFGDITNVNNLFQIAHTLQFCGQTLDYVMSTLGYESFYLDEQICSFWRRKEGMEKNLTAIKPVEWVDFCMDQVFNKVSRKLPNFRGVCKFTRRARYENIVENCKRHVPDISEITNKYSGDLVVVAGGPSVDGQLDTIKELHARGIPVMAIARMYPYCVENDLGPDFVVSMDAMEEQEKGFEKIRKGTLHLMCSVTRPSLFKDLPEGSAYIWDNMDEPKVKNIRRDAGYTVGTVIRGGATVVVSTLSLGMNLGFSDFHVFGADCMFADKAQSHAKGIVGESVTNVEEVVTIKDVEYKSTAPFVMFATHILNMVWAGYCAGLLTSIKFYGESLINAMWDGKFLTDEEIETREKEQVNGNHDS